ncbi:hypothetical protein C8Q76DRAFT_791325 [Earliella scabrosa]|nr:hypothetical protein C8Q76DRAFT_791295 [Earliella scabrosa]KAI0740942.1 hypothetical protein C8Q76DRAFT_791325 [Earliella scabrosa]
MGVLDRPNRNQLHTRCRKLPAYQMCNAVLNSQPTFASEEAGLKHTGRTSARRRCIGTKKNDTSKTSRAIQVLEPLNQTIAQLSQEDHANVKLNPNIGGVGKAIHQHVIKKIYWRDIGIGVWNVMEVSAVTIL